MGKLNDLTGKKFGRWTVLYRDGTKRKAAAWLCECSCGNKNTVPSGQLLNGSSKSCGCARIEKTKRLLPLPDMSQHRLKEVLSYNEKTGDFVWLESLSPAVMIDSIAGTKTKNGYIRIAIDNNSYQAHRLAWLYVHGYLPKKQIDHINRKRDDNRICNLREVSNSQNQMNCGMKSNNTSGVTGVSYHKTKNKWESYITANKKVIYLGSFKSKNEAIEARKAAEIFHYGIYRRTYL